MNNTTSTPSPELIKTTIGEFKFKDNRNQFKRSITNKKDEFFVVKEIILTKIPGVNNKILIELIMPDPETVDVVTHKKIRTITKEVPLHE